MEHIRDPRHHRGRLGVVVPGLAITRFSPADRRPHVGKAGAGRRVTQVGPIVEPEDARSVGAGTAEQHRNRAGGRLVDSSRGQHDHRHALEVGHVELRQQFGQGRVAALCSVGLLAQPRVLVAQLSVAIVERVLRSLEPLDHGAVEQRDTGEQPDCQRQEDGDDAHDVESKIDHGSFVQPVMLDQIECRSS